MESFVIELFHVILKLMHGVEIIVQFESSYKSVELIWAKTDRKQLALLYSIFMCLIVFFSLSFRIQRIVKTMKANPILWERSKNAMNCVAI